MRLHHLHLPSPTSYTHALHLQDLLLTRQFAYRASLKISPLPQPNPTLLTFQTHPTYTVGRRHLKTSPLSDDQIKYLSAGGLATFHASPRGGLLTYHAPGQVTGFLVLDLRRHGLSPRCYVRMLEHAVMRTCARTDVEVVTTADPGVWVAKDGKATDRKVCAVGVHVSRGVTSHGVGLNVLDARAAKEYETDGGYLSWGFGRIVACGLEGKSVTWLQREGGDVTIKDVADALAGEVAGGLQMGQEDVVEMEKKDLTDGEDEY